MIRWVRYAPLDRIDAYAAIGWVDTGPAPGGHGKWSHIMAYEAPLEDGAMPPEPAKEIEAAR